MRYKVSITGGFTGILQEYEGVLDLEVEKEKQLLKYLETGPPEPNILLRDGRLYQIKLTTVSQDCQSVFDESNLPQVLRRFIDEIRDR